MRRSRSTRARLQKINLEATRALAKLPITEAASWLNEVDVPGRDAGLAHRASRRWPADHAAYRYTATFKPRDKSSKPKLASAHLRAGDDAQAGLDQAVAIAEGVRFARELANLPPNICTPAYIAEQAQAFAESARTGSAATCSTKWRWKSSASARCWPSVAARSTSPG